MIVWRPDFLFVIVRRAGETGCTAAAVICTDRVGLGRPLTVVHALGVCVRVRVCVLPVSCVTAQDQVLDFHQWFQTRRRAI